MMILKACETIFGQYQMHIFAVVLYFAIMQFKINKRLEVQMAKCDGRFNVMAVKIAELNKDVAENKQNMKVRLVK